MLTGYLQHLHVLLTCWHLEFTFFSFIFLGLVFFFFFLLSLAGQLNLAFFLIDEQTNCSETLDALRDKNALQLLIFQSEVFSLFLVLIVDNCLLETLRDRCKTEFLILEHIVHLSINLVCNLVRLGT